MGMAVATLSLHLSSGGGPLSHGYQNERFHYKTGKPTYSSPQQIDKKANSAQRRKFPMLVDCGRGSMHYFFFTPSPHAHMDKKKSGFEVKHCVRKIGHAG